MLSIIICYPSSYAIDHHITSIIICYRSSYAIDHHMLSIIICYPSSYAIHHHMLSIIICYRSSYAIDHHILSIIICYPSSYAIHHHMLSIIICYRSSYAIDHHMLSIIIFYRSSYPVDHYMLSIIICYPSSYAIDHHIICVSMSCTLTHLTHPAHNHLLAPAHHDDYDQIRGSIPLFWEQPSAWRLQPVATASPDRSSHRLAVQAHLADIADTYLHHTTAPPYSSNDSSSSFSSRHYRAPDKKTIVLINLIDKKGMQGSLGELLFMTMMDMAIAAVTKTSSHSTGTNDPSCNTSSLSADKQQSWDWNISERVLKADLLDRNHTSFHRFGIRVPIFNGQQSCTAGASSSSSSSSLPVDVCLLWFDYHHKCRGGVSSILELFVYIQPYISSMHGMFVHRTMTLLDFKTGSARGIDNSTTAAHSHQRYIIRTNCMDCLDRTNVVQTAVSRWALLRQMAALISSSTAHRRRSDAMNNLQLANDQVGQ